MRRVVFCAVACSVFSFVAAAAVGEGKYFLSRLSLQHREHKGMGYDQGYTTAALFMCPKVGILGLPFVDGRVHVFNNEDVAANLGLGARFSDAEQNYLFGLNAYYDYRNVKWLTTHQLAAGIEMLSRHVDVRVNGYYPFCGKYQDDPILFKGFEGHSLLVKQKVRYALPCADAELGFTLPNPFDEIGLYLGLGGYYLFKQRGFNQTVGNVAGVRARLTASPSSYLSFGAEYTYDKLFRGRANGFIALNIPLGRNRALSSTKRIQQPSWLAVQTQSVVRNEIIPIARETHTFCHLQANGEPLRFIFVNNQKGNGGDGSFENPYATLSQATAFADGSDILYVFAGDGTSKGYDEGITPKAYQTFASSGVSVDINGVAIPALTPHQLPILTTQDGAVVEIRHPGARIHGFKIEGKNEHAVYMKEGSVTLTDSEVIAAEGFSALHREEGGFPCTFINNTFIGRGGNAPVVQVVGSSSACKIMDNTIVAANGQTGLLLQRPGHATYVVGNTLIATDPSGTAIAYELSEESTDQVCMRNRVEIGFYKALDVHSEGERSVILEVTDNKFISETLGVGVAYENRSLDGRILLHNNQIVASQEGISLSDTESSKSSIEITGNSLHSYAGVASITSVFSGEIDVRIAENTITYTPNVTGSFSGISAHLKGEAHETDRLVIERNQVNMPAGNEAVHVVNEKDRAAAQVTPNES